MTGEQFSTSTKSGADVGRRLLRRGRACGEGSELAGCNPTLQLDEEDLEA
jgi:hypothetical protein